MASNFEGFENSFMQDNEHNSASQSSTHASTASNGQRARALVREGMETFPTLVVFPNLPYTNLPDERIRSFTHSDFPSVDIPDTTFVRLPHYALRFWIKFVAADGQPITPADEPDFNESEERDNHSNLLRDSLVRHKIVLQSFADNMKFFYSWTEPKTHEQDGKPTFEKPRLYADIQLPFWYPKGAEKLTIPGMLSTNKTRLEYVGHEGGRGPIARPQYALAEMQIPDRINGELIAADEEAFMHYCSLAQESFEVWKTRHNTCQDIVAWGGYFQQGDPTLSWSHRMFAVYRVRVPDEFTGTAVLNDLREELRNFPPFTMLGRIRVRNNLNFRFCCPECLYDAEYIHDVKGHKCSTCSEIGHVRKECPKGAKAYNNRRTKPKSSKRTTFMTAILPDAQNQWGDDLIQDPEMLAYEKMVVERSSKRRRAN